MIGLAILILSFYSFSVNSYDENVNVRSFGFDAMWGSIGGYVGMVLGISLFQLPNLMYNSFHFLKSFKNAVDHNMFLKMNAVDHKV